MTAKNTSFVPAAAAAKGPIPCLRLRTIFSITTIASSTTIPVASTSARRLMVLTENPVSQIAATVPTSDTGMVTAGIITARGERRKAKITTTTIPVAKAMDFITSVKDPLMNVPSSEVTNSRTPSGSADCRSATATATSSEIDSVLPTDCRVMSMPTAVCPFTRVSTASSSGSSRTNATSETRVFASIGIWPTVSTVTFALPTRSAKVCASESSDPSGVSSRSAASASETSNRVIPRLSNAGISSVTRNSLGCSPRRVTSAMPSMVDSRS